MAIHNILPAMAKVPQPQRKYKVDNTCFATIKQLTSQKKLCTGLHKTTIAELQSITCHIGSDSVTCHPTQVNMPCLKPSQIAQSSKTMWFSITAQCVHVHIYMERVAKHTLSSRSHNSVMPSASGTKSFMLNF